MSLSKIIVDFLWPHLKDKIVETIKEEIAELTQCTKTTAVEKASTVVNSTVNKIKGIFTK